MTHSWYLVKNRRERICSFRLVGFGLLKVNAFRTQFSSRGWRGPEGISAICPASYTVHGIGPVLMLVEHWSPGRLAGSGRCQEELWAGRMKRHLVVDVPRAQNSCFQSCKICRLASFKFCSLVWVFSLRLAFQDVCPQGINVLTLRANSTDQACTACILAAVRPHLMWHSPVPRAEPEELDVPAVDFLLLLCLVHLKGSSWSMG